MPTINVPSAKNYSVPLNAIPMVTAAEPREGNKLIPVQIDWADMASDQGAVYFNFQNNATLEISQIASLSIDNSACGSDIQFIFTDTSETTTIPAYAPKVIVPVFSNRQDFYVVASQFIREEDITRFSILNFLVPPTSVPFTVEQSTVAAENLAADGTTDHELIAPSIDGTILGIQVVRSSPFPNVGFQTFAIQDGTGAILFVGQFDNGTANSSGSAILLDLNPIHVRFLDGLSLTQTGVDIGGSYCVNLLYRTP